MQSLSRNVRQSTALSLVTSCFSALLLLLLLIFVDKRLGYYTCFWSIESQTRPPTLFPTILWASHECPSSQTQTTALCGHFIWLSVLRKYDAKTFSTRRSHPLLFSYVLYICYLFNKLWLTHCMPTVSALLVFFLSTAPNTYFDASVHTTTVFSTFGDAIVRRLAQRFFNAWKDLLAFSVHTNPGSYVVSSGSGVGICEKPRTNPLLKKVNVKNYLGFSFGFDRCASELCYVFSRPAPMSCSNEIYSATSNREPDHTKFLSLNFKLLSLCGHTQRWDDLYALQCSLKW